MKPSIRVQASAYASLLLPAGLLIALDQLTKWLVRANLNYLEMWSPWPWLMPYARLVHIHNTGAAFGMFQGYNPFFVVLAFVVSSVILYYYPRLPAREWPLRLALTLQFAGAVGNLIDRLHQGYVTDFISVGRFAIFNIADACISSGVVVLLAAMLWPEIQARLHPGEKGTAAQIVLADETAAATETERMQPEEQPGEERL